MTDKNKGFGVDSVIKDIEVFYQEYCNGLILKGTFINNSIKALEDLRNHELHGIREIVSQYGYKLVQKDD